MPISAQVIKHSKSKVCGKELITLEIDFHRFILPELNTYRMISRNYQSSRAIPVERQIQMVLEDPAIPVHWGKNQPGMVANVECTSLVGGVTAKEAWLECAALAAECAKKFHEAGYHKQLVNRLLEPFMLTKGVWTGTKEAYEHVFRQRIHPNAQPEFKALAELMKAAIDKSDPQELEWEQWHLPYVDSTDGTEDNKTISISCCAQVSYRRLDDSIDKARKVVNMLHLDKHSKEPPHWSPTEHQACIDKSGWSRYSGNFGLSSFMQLRKIMGG
jgi:thymidylate synthase ThyX